ncbi:MAG: short-chain dehydrogenase, partial [Acidimicrobiaceae bacterium]|nr:short-chain dehydrogenase [Acidimicrobiaceae bacterium]
MSVLVTGASSGIGRAFALDYAAEGKDLILAARSSSGLRVVEDEVKALGGRARSITVDLSSAAGVDLLIDACGEVDTLVANAGVTLAAPIGSIGRDQVDATAYLMTAGVARLCEALVPAMMAAGRGDVVIVSSIAAFVPMKKSAAYAASKAFATSYAKSLDLEVRASGIRVAALCPGYVRTDLHRRAGL